MKINNREVQDIRTETYYITHPEHGELVYIDYFSGRKVIDTVLRSEMGEDLSTTDYAPALIDEIQELIDETYGLTG